MRFRKRVDLKSRAEAMRISRCTCGMNDEPIASPCISVCRMDEASGLCEGCLRTLDEIALWSVLDEDDKRQVLLEISSRRLAWPAPPATRSAG